MAGFSYDLETGTESVENTKLNINEQIIARNLELGNMSDCGKLAVRMNMFEDVLEKSIFNSIKSFKTLITSLANQEDISTALTEGEYIMPNLFMQNLRTDSKIYFLTFLDFSLTDSISQKIINDTLIFAVKFRKNVGMCLQYNDQQRKNKENAEIDLKSMLKELKDEPIQKTSENIPVSEDLRNINETTIHVPIIGPNVSQKSKDQSIFSQAIPADLVTKLAEFTEFAAPTHFGGGKPEEPIPDPTISKINAVCSERENGTNTNILSFFEGEENAMFQNIRQNNIAIKEQLNVFLKQAESERPSKISERVQVPPSIPEKEENIENDSEEKATEKKREDMLATLGKQLLFDSMNCMKEFSKRAIKCAKLIKLEKRGKSCFCNKYCGNEERKIFNLNESFDEPLVRNVFFPVAVFEPVQRKISKKLDLNSSLIKIRENPKRRTLKKSRIIAEDLSISKNYQGMFNGKSSGATSNTKKLNKEFDSSFISSEHKVSLSTVKKKSTKDTGLNHSKYGIRLKNEWFCQDALRKELFKNEKKGNTVQLPPIKSKKT